jgi:hypothetical protein
MHWLSRNARNRRACVWVGVLMLLAGCGNDPAGNAHVEYDGQTLVVDGTAYEREATFDSPGIDLPGRVVVQHVEEKTDDALALVERYGLVLEGRSSEGWLLVKVPSGYEMQWATAFTMHLGAPSSATTDSAQSPTPVAVAAPQNVDVAADATPVPDGEPSEADVRRIITENYELIDKAGGLPVTATATGQSLVLRGKVFEARKESCRKLPGARPGEWECSANLMVGLCSGDCDPSMEEPSPKGERVRIRWNPEQGRFTSGG